MVLPSPPYWQACFPLDITADLVSNDNLHSTITNSDLELAGMIAQNNIFGQQYDCSGRMVIPLSDNMPSIAWSHKGSVTTLGATGYLLWLNSLHPFQVVLHPRQSQPDGGRL